MENIQKNVPVQQKQLSKGIFIPKSILIIFGIFISGFLVFGIFFYAGYLFSNRSKIKPPLLDIETTKKQQLTPKITEVPYGDEFTETDPGWKEAVDKTTEEYKKTQMLYYKNDDYKFAFYYPTGIFVEKNPRPLQEGPIIFLDTKLIDVPEVYGGPLTPVEISIRTKTLTQELDSFKNGGYTDPLAYREKELPPNLKAKGVWASSIMKGFMEGSGIETVLLKGSKGLIDISYYPNESFSSKDLQQILNTFELF